MSSIILASQNTHALPDQWLGARVRGWMMAEAKGSDWWICALQSDGKMRVARFPENAPMHKDWSDYAEKLCVHLNKHVSVGGAWLVGYVGHMLYAIWKDKDGDIQVVKEYGGDGNPMPLSRLLQYSMDDHASQCLECLETWWEWHKRLDQGKSQQIKLAQGQRASAEHEAEAEKYSLTPQQLH